MLPCVDTGEEKVDPLRDERVAQLLKKKQGIGHCCIRRSFNEEVSQDQRRNTVRLVSLQAVTLLHTNFFTGQRPTFPTNKPIKICTFRRFGRRS